MRGELGGLLCAVSQSGALSTSRGEGAPYPIRASQRGGHCPAALPDAARSRDTHSPSGGLSSVWVAGPAPPLARSLHPSPSGDIYPEGPHRPRWRAQLVPTPAWRALRQKGRGREAQSPRRSGGSCGGGRDRGGDAAPPRKAAPLGTRSSKQSPEPLVPAATGARSSPRGRARGCQGHYKFPALHGAQPRPRADNKRLRSLPLRPRCAPSPTPKPKPVAGRTRRSSAQPPPALEGRAPFAAFATGTGRLGGPHPPRPLGSPPARQGGRAPGPAHAPSGHPRRRGPGRRRACARRGWGGSRHRARRVSGAQG